MTNSEQSLSVEVANGNEDRGVAHRNAPCPDAGRCDYCGADTGRCFYDQMVRSRSPLEDNSNG